MTGKLAILRPAEVRFRVKPQPTRQKHPLGRVYQDAYGARFVVVDDETR